MRAPKTPRSTGTPSASSACAERFVERLCELRRCGVGEARAVALRRVRDERELADDESRATDVEQGAVEVAVVVLEDPQAGDLAGKPFGLGVVVIACDAQKHAHASADGAAWRDARARDALDDRSHASSRMCTS